MWTSGGLPAAKPDLRWAFPPLLPPLHLGWAPPGPATAAAAAATPAATAAATAPAGHPPWTALPVPLTTLDAAAAADRAPTVAGRKAAFQAAAPPGYVTNYYRRSVGRGEQAWRRASAALTSTAALRLPWVSVTVVRAAAAVAASATPADAGAGAVSERRLLAPGDALVIAARPLPLPLWSVNVNRVLAVAAPSPPPPPPPRSPPAAPHSSAAAAATAVAAADSRAGRYGSSAVAAQRVALVWGTTPSHALRGEELVTLTRHPGGAKAGREVTPAMATRSRRWPGSRPPLSPSVEAEAEEVVFELVSYSRGLAVPARLGGCWVRSMQRAFARGVGDRLAAAATAA